MGHGEHFDAILQNPIDHKKGETAKENPSGLTIKAWPAIRSLRNRGNCNFQLFNKPFRYAGAALGIPENRGLRFPRRFGMKPYLDVHFPVWPVSRLRTSGQGTA